MYILVTGGAGFIGSNFLLYFFEKNPNAKIINLDFLTYASNISNLNKLKNNPNYVFIQGYNIYLILLKSFIKLRLDGIF